MTCSVKDCKAKAIAKLTKKPGPKPHNVCPKHLAQEIDEFEQLTVTPKRMEIEMVNEPRPDTV